MILKYAKDIKTKDDIKFLLDFLKPYNQVIDESGFDEYSVEYENMCESVAEQLYEIDEALIGLQKINNNNLYKTDIRMMTYWNYLKGEINFNKFIKNIKKYSNNLLINL